MFLGLGRLSSPRSDFMGSKVYVRFIRQVDLTWWCRGRPYHARVVGKAYKEEALDLRQLPPWKVGLSCRWVAGG